MEVIFLMKKKNIVIASALSLGLILTGCGAKKETPDSLMKKNEEAFAKVTSFALDGSIHVDELADVTVKGKVSDFGYNKPIKNLTAEVEATLDNKKENKKENIKVLIKDGYIYSKADGGNWRVEEAFKEEGEKTFKEIYEKTNTVSKEDKKMKEKMEKTYKVENKDGEYVLTSKITDEIMKEIIESASKEELKDTPKAEGQPDIAQILKSFKISMDATNKYDEKTYHLNSSSLKINVESDFLTLFVNNNKLTAKVAYKLTDYNKVSKIEIPKEAKEALKYFKSHGFNEGEDMMFDENRTEEPSFNLSEDATFGDTEGIFGDTENTNVETEEPVLSL